MSADAFYRLTEPSVWRTSIERVSHSSLKALEQCPRQWQLLRSEWPGFGTFPQRRHRATVEGTLVHAMLDRIFRAMALRGLPKPGSAVFRTVLSEIDVLGTFRREIDAWDAAVATHPRAAALRFPMTERALYNKLSELFQAEYARVEPGVAHETTAHRDDDSVGAPLALLLRRGVLTEWDVAHPTLPVRGQIDLLRRDERGTHVIDFKTGAPKPEYQDQLALYALLWWRATDDLPVSTELRHPRGRVEYPVDRGLLESTESALATRITKAKLALSSTPARAIPGEHCRFCDVRAFCHEYWTGLSSPTAGTRGLREEFVDLEVTAGSPITANGFVARATRGVSLPFVYDDESAAQHGPFVDGERLRVIGGVWNPAEASLRLTTRTEVFHAESIPPPEAR